MARRTEARTQELIDQLSARTISLEQFLWGAREAGIDRHQAALHAVAATATGTPGTRTAGGGPRAPRADGVFRVGLWLPPDGLDPAIATYRTSRLLTEQLYSTLMALDAAGNPYPDLAEWVEVSDDGLSYTFGLVPGVRFHDGSDVTAADVAFSLDRICEMGEAYHFDPWLVTMAGTEVVDRLTVRVRLTRPTGPILTWLAFCGTGVLPRAAVEGGRDFMRQPIGSGPFRLAEAWPGPEGDAPVRLARHDASARGGSPFTSRLAGLEFHTIRDEDARTEALLAGRIDLDALASPRSWQRAASTPGFVAHATPDSRWHWLVVNCRRPPLDDVRVRRAIAMAIDRRALIDEGFVGLGAPLGAGVVAPWSWATASSLAGFGDRADRVSARALLAEAGVAPGTRLAITAADHLGIAIHQAQLIAGQLQAVGLGAEVSIVDGAAYAASVSRDGDFQLATSYWGSPIWDPDDFVYMGFRSGARYDAGSCSSPALDALMDAGRGTVEQSARLRAYADLQALALEQLPVIPTIQPAMLRCVSASLRGYVPTPCAQLRTLRDAWLEA